jgi:hypothetical protein
MGFFFLPAGRAKIVFKTIAADGQVTAAAALRTAPADGLPALRALFEAAVAAAVVTILAVTNAVTAEVPLTPFAKMGFIAGKRASAVLAQAALPVIQGHVG